ncbi:MAG: gamma-glutamyl-gamma-aminobutyrate hydrolase family protein [bacterium]|nr:gamma-glutamyl-gamma-aminobutyrate hydrolase family protein [bacterium]
MIKKLLIVKLGSSHPELIARYGDFEDWIQTAARVKRSSVEIVSPLNAASLPNPLDFSGTILSGSHAMVTDQNEWSLRTEEWIRRVMVPLLGICYGHQLIASAAGGSVAENPNGREFRTITLSVSGNACSDPLFLSASRQIHPQLSVGHSSSEH